MECGSNTILTDDNQW